MALVTAAEISSIQSQVAPTRSDDLVSLIEVWRMPGEPVGTEVPGGAGVDVYGFPTGDVGSTPDPDRPDQEREKVGELPARIVRSGSGKEAEAGAQPVSVAPWTLIFNWADFDANGSDIRGGDKLLEARAEYVDGLTQRTVWQASTAYAVGAIVQPTASNGRYYRVKATTTGISGAVEPLWPKTPQGATVVDGGITWEYVDTLRTFEVVDPGNAATFKILRAVGCEEIKA